MILQGRYQKKKGCCFFQNIKKLNILDTLSVPDIARYKQGLRDEPDFFLRIFTNNIKKQTTLNADLQKAQR